jgi:hypothetical protein
MSVAAYEFAAHGAEDQVRESVGPPASVHHPLVLGPGPPSQRPYRSSSSRSVTQAYERTISLRSVCS